MGTLARHASGRAVAAAGGPLVAYDASVTSSDASERPVSVTFEDGGSVRMGAPAPSVLKLRPPRWRVRAGPAHLDTCEFEVDVAGGRAAFCGYVDRGPAHRGAVLRRPIRVSGFAFEKGDSAAAAGPRTRGRAWPVPDVGARAELMGGEVSSGVISAYRASHASFAICVSSARSWAS